MSILTINNLSIRKGNTYILKNINAEIKKNDIISIISPDKEATSSFLKAINFIEPASEGEILFYGKRITKKNINLSRRKIVMISKNPGLFNHKTVFENLTLGPLKYFGISKSLAEDNALLLLKSVGMVEKANYYPHQLTLGQKHRVSIARSLAMNPEIILIDNITDDLDQLMISEVMAVIRSISKDITMLIATDEIDFIRNASKRIFYLDENTLLEEGSPDQIFDNPQQKKTKDYINKLCSFVFEITSIDFDFVEMFSEVENFSIKNRFDNKSAIKLQLLAEELVVNIVTPLYHAATFKIFHAEKQGTFLVSISYKGEESNALDKTEDTLSVKLIRKCAKRIWHSFSGEDNTIYVEF